MAELAQLSCSRCQRLATPTSSRADVLGERASSNSDEPLFPGCTASSLGRKAAGQREHESCASSAMVRSKTASHVPKGTAQTRCSAHIGGTRPHARSHSGFPPKLADALSHGLQDVLFLTHRSRRGSSSPGGAGGRAPAAPPRPRTSAAASPRRAARALAARTRRLASTRASAEPDVALDLVDGSRTLVVPAARSRGRVARPSATARATAASVTGIRGTRPRGRATSAAVQHRGDLGRLALVVRRAIPSLRTPTDSRRESRGGSDRAAPRAAVVPSCSMGFRVANTRNGSGSACVVFPTVTRCS